MRIRFARACEDGGIPIEGLAAAIRAGRLSFAFVELWPFERTAGTAQTYAELSEETAVPFPTVQRAVEAFGFARPEPSHVVAEGAEPVVSLVGRALALGVIDEVTSVRLGHLYASRISDRAAAGQVLVGEAVMRATSVPGVTFDGVGRTRLSGLDSPIDLFEARRLGRMVD